jgi:hypothetical protein
MNAIKHWILAGAVAGGILLVPLHNANADGPYGDGYNGGYRGGYPAGRHGGYYGHHGYRGGYRGDCWNCGAAGAAIIGLAIGALVGSAIADATAPPVAVGPRDLRRPGVAPQWSWVASRTTTAMTTATTTATATTITPDPTTTGTVTRYATTAGRPSNRLRAEPTMATRPSLPRHAGRTRSR